MRNKCYQRKLVLYQYDEWIVQEINDENPNGS